MSNPSFYLPTATIETLQQRARLVAALRQFFDTRGYWEVHTPVLSQDGPCDVHLEPFVTYGDRATSNAGPLSAVKPRYFQASPEFAMKRLLVAGAQAIYQLGPVFRYGELGQRHNPEFTMLEWYRAGDTHLEQMAVTEALVADILSRGAELQSSAVPNFPRPYRRTTYRQAFQKHVGIDVAQADETALQAVARRQGVSIPESLAADDRDGWLNLLLAECVEPQLGRGGPEFLYDYPASQSTLARIRHDETFPVAERFELYHAGVELCNGYRELTDAAELRERIQRTDAERRARGLSPLPPADLLLAAQDRGLPACAGVALGVDRLIMRALGLQNVAEVIAFPWDRA